MSCVYFRQNISRHKWEVCFEFGHYPPPPHDLLQKDLPWKWTEECKREFVQNKEKLQDSPLLVLCNLKKPPRLVCYASAYGLRAVISHVMESGEEKPLITFASWTLTASDCNYSQIEKRHCPLCSWWRSFIHTFMASSLCHYFWSKDRGASIGSSQIAKIGPWF